MSSKLFQKDATSPATKPGEQSIEKYVHQVAPGTQIISIIHPIQAPKPSPLGMLANYRFDLRLQVSRRETIAGKNKDLSTAFGPPMRCALAALVATDNGRNVPRPVR